MEDLKKKAIGNLPKGSKLLSVGREVNGKKTFVVAVYEYNGQTYRAKINTKARA